MHMNQTKVHHRESTEVHNTLNLNQVQNNQMHVNTRDPAITLLVEQVAEARHCEALANTEQVVQTMVSEMSRWFNAEEEAASARMQQMTKLAESREGQYREELVQQGVVYKRVLDGNARQSNATKDQQIQALKDHYKRQDESRRMQLSQLDSIIQQQSEQIKAQQLQTESMNMRMGKLLNTLGPLPIPVVHTATATLPPDTAVKLSAPLSSFASASAFGGLWEQHCEAKLLLVGFVMPDPEGWPSVFFHPELKLLLVVYVDDFKMSGPKENMSKGWNLIADMDTRASQ